MKGTIKRIIMHTISITNHKGGVGKTTTSINLAGYFSQKGKKTLVVDLDPQANLSNGLGFDEEDNSLYEALLKGEAISIFEKSENLFIVPCSIKLADAEIELSSKIAREQKLKKVLSKYKEHFDICIIDCPPSLSLLTINSLVASDSILIPLEAKFFSLTALDSINRIFGEVKDNFNNNLKIIGFFFNEYDKRLILTKTVKNQIEKEYGEKLLKSTIRTNVALSECSTPPNSTHIFDYEAKSNGAQDYESLGEELLKLIEND